MHLQYRSILTLVLTGAAAGSNLEARKQPLEVCFTSFGTKSQTHVSTYSNKFTITQAITQTKWIFPSTTITPTPFTTTSVSTVTSTVDITESTMTDTVTVTWTSTSTDTETAPTSTSTIVNTETDTTTSTSTSTVAAPSGFLPIESTLPGSVYKHKRDINGASLLARRGDQSQHGICSGPSKNYPQSVSCNVYTYKTVVKTVTKSKPTCTKTAHTPTVTATSTATSTSTSTIYPSDVSTTVTNTETDTSTVFTTPLTTVTSTSTTTATVQAQATYYAQCANNNYASQGPSGNLDNLLDANPSIQITTTDNSYDCCALCAQNPNCVWGVTELQLTSSNCLVIVANSCTSASQYSFSIQQTAPTRSYEYYNGNCGQINSFY